MACLRSIWRRISLFPRQFRSSFEPILHNNKDDSKSESANSCRLIREPSPYGLHCVDHRLGGCSFKVGKYTSFARPVGSGFSFCRYMSSSKAEELSHTGDAFGTSIEELVSDKTVEVAAAQVSTMSEVAVAAADSSLPVACVQYFIDGVHVFTGFNWWASIALTAFLVQGMHFPVVKEMLRFLRNCTISLPSANVEELTNLLKKFQDDDANSQAEKERFDACIEKCRPYVISCVNTICLQGFINVYCIIAIRNMAEKIPSFKTGGILWFTDLTTPDFYLLPVLMGLTVFFTRELRFKFVKPYKRVNLAARNNMLIAMVFTSVSVQYAFGFEPAVYCFLIPSRLMTTFAASLVIVWAKKQNEFACIFENETSLPESPSVFSLLSNVIKKALSFRKQHHDKERRSKKKK